MKNALLFIFSLLIFSTINGYGQSSKNYFKPKIWLFDITKKDTLKSELNTHQQLKLGEKTNWYTKNKLSSSNNLFIVFKSKESEPILSILGQNRSFFLQTDSFRLKDKEDLKGYNQAYGELIDFRLGNLGENTLFLNSKLKETEFYELILTQGLNEFKTNEIRTYLSIKYGIDLIDNTQYVYKDNKQLWKKDKNDYHLFGIGRFDYFNLVQKKSIHSKNQEWTIQYADDKQVTQLKDGDYVLMGNNNKPSRFIKNTNQREWTLQNNSPTTINLDWSSNTNDSLASYYIELDNKRYDGEYYQQHITFRNIPLPSGVHQLRLHRRLVNVLIHSESFCEETLIEIETTDTPSKPVHYTIFNEKNDILSKGTYQSPIRIAHGDSKKLTIELISNQQTYHHTLSTIDKAWETIEFQSQYVLDENNSSLSFTLPASLETINWVKDGKEWKNTADVSITEPGHYQVRLVNGDMCEQTYSFHVLQATKTDQWIVYPNPADVNQTVQCAFNFSTNKKVELKIYQEDGKLVQTFPAFETQYQSHISFQLPSTGVYMLVATIDQHLEIKKLIIK